MNPILNSLDVLPIRTARLELRKIRRDDASFFFDMFSNSEVMRYWSAPPMSDRSQAELWVEEAVRSYDRGQWFPLVAARVEDEAPIGYCSLHSFHFESRRAELGYALAHPYWGAGYMHEALCAVVDFAFGQLSLHRLEADLDPENAASARTVERLGFVREGHLRERWIVDGTITDSWIYGLLEQEWRSRNS